MLIRFLGNYMEPLPLAVHSIKSGYKVLCSAPECKACDQTLFDNASPKKLQLGWAVTIIDDPKKRDRLEYLRNRLTRYRSKPRRFKRQYERLTRHPNRAYGPIKLIGVPVR